MSKPKRNQSRRRATGSFAGSGPLFFIFALLVGINVYVFFLRGGTSITDVLKTSAIAGQTLSPKNPLKEALESSSTPEMASHTATTPATQRKILKGTLKGHLGLSAALVDMGLSINLSAQIIDALMPLLDMRALRPEHSFEAVMDGQESDTLIAFTYHLSRIRKIVVRPDDRGRFKAVAVEAELQRKVVTAGGKIDSSLNQALSSAGESSALVAQFVDLFSWDINWYVDPRQGDEVRVVVEKLYHGDKFYKYGRILAAEYRGRSDRYQAYYYESSKGQTGYYNEEGRSIRRSLLKTPLRYRRISSHFNQKRFHPVLHRTKGHFGVDYAAATGTPVWAAADGVVVSAKPSGGAGNMVVLSHPGGIATLYMHLSRFAPGIRPGVRVRQQQVIGAVGMTGLATGPHLHYGMKVRGNYVDPLNFKVAKGALLSSAERRRFMQQLAPRRAELEGVSTQEKIALR